ncbi:MAG: BamA/TamA family outer membrane protein [Xanthomonadales bacterium]|nr:BamA/TamA family outer membrane protein [Xanthomonadales bacterium]
MFGSELRSELTASYRWPKQDPRKEWFSVVAGLQSEETDSYDNDTVKLGLRRSMKRGGSWLETRYVDYLSEDYRVGDEAQRSSELVIFGSNWEYTRGRDVSRTREGRRYNFDIRGASDSLGSDTSFLQVKASAKWIHSFDDRTRLLARTRLGATWKDALADLPASVRFFAGGDSSVRGYAYESLGELDAQGNVVGGSHLAELSVEIERMVRDQWAVAAFVDSGSAFNGKDPDFSTGIGLGLRWYSPVGPVRLDFAHPLDDPDKSLRIHVSLGLDL